MYILLGLIILFILFLVLAIYRDENFFVLTFTTGIILIFMLFILWISHCNVNYHINQRLVEKQMYEEYLKDPSKEAERVAFLPKIIEYNQEILSDQYWNNTQWDWWIDDKYTKMELIK